jgi:acyl phosphate:glycerol-3-phosphate acyltransferase
MMTVLLIVSLFVAYSLGAIPFSLVIGRKVKGIDLRHHGSGNLGATNVYRTLGPGWAGLCFALDLLKGVAAVLLMTAIVNNWPEGSHFTLNRTGDFFRVLAGFFAILGHSFSPFASWHGGKGIATSFGVCLVLEPYPSLIAFALFLITFLATRIVSAGSIVAAVTFPALVIFFEWRNDDTLSKTLVVFSVILGLLILWRHRGNIHRLRSGQEKKLEAPPNGNDSRRS